MKKIVAEVIGTAALVFFGCGAAIFAGAEIGTAGIAAAFGLAIVAMAYGIGAISGCHINPAVSFGAFVAGRMDAGEMIKYWIAQFIGATAGAAILYLIATNTASGESAAGAMGTNGWGADYGGGYNVTAAFVFEVVATFLFLVTILGVTHRNGGHPAVAGLAIGLALWVIHLVGIQITGTSVNPARSFGPALFHMPAMSKIWLFIVAPLIGAGLAGILFRSGLLEDND